LKTLFPQNQSDKRFTNPTFQVDSSPIHTARNVQSWFEEHEDALQHLPWPAWSPDLYTIEPLCSVLDSSVRCRIPPQSSLKELDVLHEEWYSIPLETIQNLYESIPSKIQAILPANDGPTPY
jgi:hypothetical protein